MNVICVDDEPLAVEYTLKQCGQLPEIDRAEGFTDAESALTYLREHSADIVLLDINMPDIDGITLAAQMFPWKSWRKKSRTFMEPGTAPPYRTFM